MNASKKQLWALYCITKHDYRNSNLTYDEASELIKKYGDVNYKSKKTSNKSIKSKIKQNTSKDNIKYIERELLEYFKTNILNDVVNALKESLGITSCVAEDLKHMNGSGKNGTSKKYIMRGFGCSISWLKYDKRSTMAKNIEKAFSNLRMTKFADLVEKQFSVKLRHQLEREGNPLRAIYWQDYSVNSILFYGIVEFAKSKGVKRITYVTHLD